MGSGGTGTVYLARVTSDYSGLEKGNRVALKVIHPHLFSTPGFEARFLREASLGRQIIHPNVVRYYASPTLEYRGSELRTVVMEYVDGKSMFEVSEDTGPLAESLLREVAGNVAQGLAAIHREGIIHRDLKPENILICPDHQIRLVDLGLLRLLDDCVRVTVEGNFIGSLPYAAPEHFRDEEVTAQADLYSLGVTLYELATGQNPFENREPARTVYAHLNLTPEPIHSINPGYSQFFSELVAALLAKSPSDRVPSAHALAELLKEGEDSRWWRERRDKLSHPVRQPPEIAVPRRTDLYGREDECAELRERWRRARRGEGNTVLVEGETGVGKTRLIDWFVRQIGPDSANVLYGDYEDTHSLGGLSESLVRFFGKDAPEDAMRPYLSGLADLATPFAALTSGQLQPGQESVLDAFALQSTLVQLMRGLAKERPLLWIMDGLQCAESDAWKLAVSLARGLTEHRVLLVLCATPDLLGEEMHHLSRVPRLRRLRPGRLSAAAVLELLTDYLGSQDAAEAMVHRVLELTDGSPLFIFEVLNALQDAGHLHRTDNGSMRLATPARSVEVPPTVRGLIQARLGGLSDEERTVLEVGAIQGSAFDPALVCAVLGQRLLTVLQHLTSVERRTGLVRAEARRYRFDHPQIRSALCRELMPDLRAEYRTLLAEAMEADLCSRPDQNPGQQLVVQVARLHVRGSRPVAALPYLDRAVEHLADSFRHEAAQELLGQALSVPGLLDGKRRMTALLQLAALLGVHSLRDRERAALEEALQLADAGEDPAEQARVRLFLGRHCRNLSRHEAAIEWLVEAGECAETCPDPALKAAVAMALGDAHAELGRTDQALAQGRTALALAKSANDHQAEAEALGSLGTLLLRQGDFAEAFILGEKALRLSLAIRDPAREAMAQSKLGTITEKLGKFGSALGHYQRQVEICRRTGQREATARGLAAIGRILSKLGDSTAAEEHLLECGRLSKEIGERPVLCLATRELGAVFERAGRFSDARREYLESVSRLGIVPYPREMGETLLALARVLAALGEHDRAHIYLDDAKAVCEELGMVDFEVLAACYQSLEPGSDPSAALQALSTNADRMDHCCRMEARLVLWKSTGDAESLAAAHRALLELQAGAPEQYRESVTSGVFLHREIMKAWEAGTGQRDQRDSG